MTKRLKILIAVLIILVLVALVIWYFSKSGADVGESVVALGTAETIAPGNQLSQANDILGVLSMLKTINLNLDFLNDAGFNSLYDFSVNLPAPEIGKSNPFAP